LTIPFVLKFFCLPRESMKISTYTILFYSFQNPVVHWATLTIGDHTVDIESKIVGSLSFLFGQILVKKFDFIKTNYKLFIVVVWQIKFRKTQNNL
jgi:hypothetical protein